MYSLYVSGKLDEGVITGYSWELDDPEKVVCIVHGIGEYAGRYDRVAERFTASGTAVEAVDLRGHGRSLGKRGDCAPREKVLDDVTRMIENAKKKYPGVPVVLYGHSMGGNIVLDYRARGAANADVQGYMISAPWLRLVRPVPALLYRLVKIISKIMPHLTISSQINEKELGNLRKVKPFNSDPLVHNRISALCAVEGYEKGLALEAGINEDNGRADRIPMLLMHGSADRICDVTASAALSALYEKRGIPVEYVEWEGLFHEIHNGGSSSTGDEVIDKMTEWTAAL